MKGERIFYDHCFVIHECMLFDKTDYKYSQSLQIKLNVG